MKQERFAVTIADGKYSVSPFSTDEEGRSPLALPDGRSIWKSHSNKETAEALAAKMNAFVAQKRGLK